MAWVRYDDGFGKHRKTLEVKARCREALALHLLCNTWSASTDRPGHVPLAAVIEEGGGKAKGLKWARALVAAGMWHAAGHDCDRCPAIEGDGYVIHDFEDYNPLAELSRKRSDAGKKGAAARWGTGGKPPPEDSKSHSNGMANAIDAPSEPHDERIATDGIARGHPLPQPPSTQLGAYVATVDAHERAPEPGEAQREHSDAGWLAAYFADRQPLTDHGKTLRVVADALAANYTAEQVRNGLDRLADQRRGCSRDQLRIAIVESDGNWRPTGPRRPGSPYLDDLRASHGEEAVNAMVGLGPDGKPPLLRAVPELEAGAS